MLSPMNLEQFEASYREVAAEALNQLQTMTLLLEQLQRSHAATGESILHLNRLVEEFIAKQQQD